MKHLSREQIDQLRSIDTPTISNAIEKFGRRPPTTGFMGLDIRCLSPGLGVMLGRAVTATADSTTPKPDRKLETRKACFRAIADVGAPSVLVIKVIGPKPSHTCVMGDILATCAQSLGAVGTVTDGGVRDLAGLQELGFHVFAKGTVPSHGTFSIEEVGVPVEISGVTVNTGDLIHADMNGVVKVPWECVEGLYDKAKTVMESEEKKIEFAKSDGFSIDALWQRFYDVRSKKE